MQKRCTFCHGNGRSRNKRCTSCHGRGHRRWEANVHASFSFPLRHILLVVILAMEQKDNMGITSDLIERHNGPHVWSELRTDKWVHSYFHTKPSLINVRISRGFSHIQSVWTWSADEYILVNHMVCSFDWYVQPHILRREFIFLKLVTKGSLIQFNRFCHRYF